jgi:hypothetical protein
LKNKERAAELADAMRHVELATRASGYLKAKMKESEITYAELVKRLKKHGFKDETEAGITMKLKRARFPQRSFLPALPPSKWKG